MQPNSVLMPWPQLWVRLHFFCLCYSTAWHPKCHVLSFLLAVLLVCVCVCILMSETGHWEAVDIMTLFFLKSVPRKKTLDKVLYVCKVMWGHWQLDHSKDWCSVEMDACMTEGDYCLGPRPCKIISTLPRWLSWKWLLCKGEARACSTRKGSALLS